MASGSQCAVHWFHEFSKDSWCRTQTIGQCNKFVQLVPNVDEKGTKVWTVIQTKSSASGARDAEITPTIPRIAEKGTVTRQKSHFNVKNKY